MKKIYTVPTLEESRAHQDSQLNPKDSDFFTRGYVAFVAPKLRKQLQYDIDLLSRTEEGRGYTDEYLQSVVLDNMIADRLKEELLQKPFDNFQKQLNSIDQLVSNLVAAECFVLFLAALAVMIELFDTHHGYNAIPNSIVANIATITAAVISVLGLTIGNRVLKRTKQKKLANNASEGYEMVVDPAYVREEIISPDKLDAYIRNVEFKRENLIKEIREKLK